MKALGLALSGLVGLAIGWPSPADRGAFGQGVIVLGLAGGLAGGCIALAIRAPLLQISQFRRGALRWLLTVLTALLGLIAGAVGVAVLAWVPGAPLWWLALHFEQTGTDMLGLGGIMILTGGVGALVSTLLWLALPARSH